MSYNQFKRRIFRNFLIIMHWLISRRLSHFVVFKLTFLTMLKITDVCLVSMIRWKEVIQFTLSEQDLSNGGLGTLGWCDRFFAYWIFYHRSVSVATYQSYHYYLLHTYQNTFSFWKIIIITRIHCKITTNWPNWMFVASLKRRELGLFAGGLNVYFEQFDAKLQSNWMDISMWLILCIEKVDFLFLLIRKTASKYNTVLLLINIFKLILTSCIHTVNTLITQNKHVTTEKYQATIKNNA